jgi:hypothetical protein
MPTNRPCAGIHSKLPRLAGFTNRKDKYRRTDGTSPYVRLHEARGAVYSKATAFLTEVKTLCEAEQSKLPPAASLQRRRLCRSNLKSIEDFRVKPIYGGDHTRVDLAYAVHALAHGVPENVARNALGSRDLTHKGGRKQRQEYLDRTIKRARERIEDRRS